MQHLPYPKIPAAQRFAATTLRGPWLATEKLHGAHLVIAHDGRTLHVGKRKAWLRSDEPFFGWQLLRHRFEQAARSAVALVGAPVRIYGELYGGAYPHPDVAPQPGATAVQTGVWYTPEIRFAVFDVLLHADGEDHGEFATYPEAAEIAAAAGLDVVPLLARGALQEVDAVPVRFGTRVPGLLGLPELPGNLAEGIVVRPDARLAPDRRPLFKLKIEEFDERRFDRSRPWDPQVRLPLEDLLHLARGLVNEPRVAGARSKVGPGRPGELLDEIVLDVLVDLTEAFPASLAALDDPEQARLEEVVRGSVRTVPDTVLTRGPGTDGVR